ncbi:MAG: Hsp20/alpha crystallin family protein [Arenicellales bacterium]|jgi:HSP20 family protein
MARQSRKVPIETEDGFHPLSSLRTEVEHVFDRLAQGLRHLRGERRPPSADASESGKGYEISIELPGMDAGDVQVTVEGDVLVVSGEKRNEREEKDRNYYLLERSYGAFRRAFRLPDDIDRERVSAEFSKGVLDISMPRAAGAEKAVRRIQVTSR